MPLTIVPVMRVFSLLLISLYCDVTWTATTVDQVKWSERARSDVEWIYSTLEENYPGFVLPDSSFKGKFANSRKACLDLAKQVDDFNSYYMLVRLATNVLGEPHLRVAPKSSQVLAKIHVRWPGFWIAFPGPTIVNDGWKIESCDGHSVSSLLRQSVFPYFGNDNGNSGEIQWGMRLFLDYQIPWLSTLAACQLSRNGESKNISLEWKEISFIDWSKKLSELQYGPRPKLEAVRKTAKTYWIRLPTFMPNDEEAATLKKILSSGDFQSSQNIVFDLRGNTGGDSRWIDPLISAALSPTEKAKYFRASKKLDLMTIQYRASPLNMERIKSIAIDPTNGTSDEELTKLASEMKTALTEGRDIVTEQFAERPVTRIVPSVRTTKKFYAITDGWCFSSCLVMLDKLNLIFNMTQLGWPTDSDTGYLQINQVDLPPVPELGGSVLQLTYPMARFDRRFRRDNIPYIPQIQFEGKPSDQQGLETWAMKKIEG